MTSSYLERVAAFIANARPIALSAFWDELNGFDWGYAWSDDHSVYQAGRERHEALRGRATLSPAHAELFQRFEAHESARNYLLALVPEKPPRPRSDP